MLHSNAVMTDNYRVTNETCSFYDKEHISFHNFLTTWTIATYKTSVYSLNHTANFYQKVLQIVLQFSTLEKLHTRISRRRADTQTRFFCQCNTLPRKLDYDTQNRDNTIYICQYNTLLPKQCNTKTMTMLFHSDY